ncbi:hypothetical protein JNW90_27485 [Micromonospora sp. STR1s_5]|nr:hypothetical protein [Micromonospora sp. STR1s_5]
MPEAMPGPIRQKQLIQESSVQFLLAEFESIRELRSLAYSIVEKRVQFIIGLQAAGAAFIGALLSQDSSAKAVSGAILALGIPTFLLAYIAYLRALDFQIQGRKYVRAMNAIRGFFVESDPTIGRALLLSTDTRFPRMNAVGYAGSTVQSLAVNALILTILVGGTVAFTAAWLIAVSVSPSNGYAYFVAALAAVGIAVLLGLIEAKRIRSRLRRAEAEMD